MESTNIKETKAGFSPAFSFATTPISFQRIHPTKDTETPQGARSDCSTASDERLFLNKICVCGILKKR